MARKMTSIEAKMSKILNAIKVKYKREYRLGSYPVDFYISEFKLTVQADGCYYHGCSRCYKERSSRQAKQQRKDNGCVLFHKMNNLNIIRFPECLINSDVFKIRDDLIKAMTLIKKGHRVLNNLQE